MKRQAAAKLTPEEMWQRMLDRRLSAPPPHAANVGRAPVAAALQAVQAPFRGPGGVLMRAIAYGPSPLNRRLCKWCIRGAHKHPGGAEVEISVLFADVRGSATIAETSALERRSLELRGREQSVDAWVLSARS